MRFAEFFHDSTNLSSRPSRVSQKAPSLASAALIDPARFAAPKNWSDNEPAMLDVSRYEVSGADNRLVFQWELNAGWDFHNGTTDLNRLEQAGQFGAPMPLTEVSPRFLNGVLRREELHALELP